MADTGGDKMKIQVHARPQFTIPFTPEDINLLVTLSEQHYDGYCRSISRPGPEGFLCGWKRRYDCTGASSPEEPLAVEATWRQLDTLAKCLEGARWLPAKQHARAFFLQGMIHRIYCVYCDIHREWRKEIEL